MARSLRPHSLLPALLAIAVAGLAVAPDAPAKMRSTKLAPGLCKTVGGGKFVDIPAFPGERIDRRLLRDIRWMRRKYRIFVTDGHSTSPIHAPNGEHPIGLALDIVPRHSRGGSWRLITRLAKLAEPRQNEPRPPWRWVGYNGDPGHGRGHHLHLSYMHAPTPPRVPARVVYTYRCPTRPQRPAEPPAEPTEPAPDPPSGGTGGSDGSTSGGGGGTGGSTSGSGSGGSGSSGGIASPTGMSAPAPAFGELAPVVAEVGGADRRAAR